MPTPQEILTGLWTIANEATLAAVIWHVLIAAAIVGLIAGWRPSRRLAATLLAVPLVSVGVLGWLYANPFNGTVFLLFAVVLGLIGLRLPVTRPVFAPWWGTVLGLLMMAFGWAYPHFLEGSWLRYAYAAPTGLIPCPTLCLVIGFALLAEGFSSRAWSWVLAFLGLFYGLFGALRLGVTIDFVLVVGATALFVQSLTRKSRLSTASGTAS